MGWVDVGTGGTTDGMTEVTGGTTGGRSSRRIACARLR
jgi:hypothetical protein